MPVLAATAGVIILREPVTVRFLLCGATILAGVVTAIAARARPLHRP